MGAWTMALPGANPVTGLAIGALAEVAGARTALATAGVLLLVIAGASWGALGLDRRVSASDARITQRHRTVGRRQANGRWSKVKR